MINFLSSQGQTQDARIEASDDRTIASARENVEDLGGEYNRPLFSSAGVIIKRPLLLWDKSGAHPYHMYDREGHEITVSGASVILLICADGQQFVTSDGQYFATR